MAGSALTLSRSSQDFGGSGSHAKCGGRGSGHTESAMSSRIGGRESHNSKGGGWVSRSNKSDGKVSHSSSSRGGGWEGSHSRSDA